MNHYYLISQLPSLDGIGDASPLPISVEEFTELCRRFLGKRAYDRLMQLTLMPPRERERTGSALIDAWYDEERRLRLALCHYRAVKLEKSCDVRIDGFSVTLLQTAHDAVELDNPLEAELFLNRYRMNILETLRPMDAFSEEMLFYYALKLKLLSRLRRFDTSRGEIAYRNIYGSIMRGAEWEADNDRDQR